MSWPAPVQGLVIRYSYLWEREARRGRDEGVPAVLDAYARARRFDAVLMAGATDGLNRLFSNDSLPARVLRDVGLGLVDRVPALKRLFIRDASGLSGAVSERFRR